MTRKAVDVVRPVVVWLGVTSAAVGAACLTPGAWHATRTGAGDGVVDLVVAGCASALALAAGWLWVITTVTVAELLTDRHRTDVVVGGTVRRWVLVACGAAVVVATSTPALAADDHVGSVGRDVLVGLTLPERAVAPAERSGPRPAEQPTIRPASIRADVHVVRPGDSLWAIAAAHPLGETSVDQRWRALWQANHDVVGDDPDLILPGQVLRLPDDPHDTDGAR